MMAKPEFKQRYGVPPSVFDTKSLRSERRAELEEIARSQFGCHRLDQLPESEGSEGFEVTLRKVPARSVAYIRVSEPYRAGVVEEATQRLVAWADRRGFAAGQWLGYMWDDPTVTALKDCRYDIAVEVPEFRPAEGIGRFDFPPLLVAELEIRGGADLELRALEWLYGTWLPRSEFVPDDYPSFEAFMGRPFAHGNEYFELWAQLPVRRLGATRSY